MAVHDVSLGRYQVNGVDVNVDSSVNVATEVHVAPTPAVAPPTTPKQLKLSWSNKNLNDVELAALQQVTSSSPRLVSTGMVM